MTILRKHSRPLHRLLAVSALSLCLAQTAQASGEPLPLAVGEVSLVLGRAYLIKPGEERELIKVGTQVSVKDTIETELNGHVHIRFVDNALFSVRPYSALEIERYDYRPEAPEQSAVKLNYLEGVLRSISGKAAKGARGNFRVNTPIAAIGVRGTDFVVRVDDDAVSAQVNEGAIVVAPFSNECVADALGPCSQNALELAGGVSQILQIAANTLNPVLLPMQGASIPQPPTATVAAKTERDENGNGGPYTASVSTRAVNQRIAGSRNNPPSGPNNPQLPEPEFTPDIAISVDALSESQLLWGRYSDARIQDERITTLVSPDLLNVADRRATVGNNSYALFRIEQGPPVVKPGLGVIGFDLLQAQAIYNGPAGSALMNVNGGTLKMDFTQALPSYTTSLNLSHAATGNVVFSDSGRIYSGGYFHDGRNDSDGLAGALSLDGNEAGYFFEKILEIGTIEGLTLWGRQP